MQSNLDDKKIKKLEKKIRHLQKKLQRSEESRKQIEQAKDHTDILYNKIIMELEVEKSKSDKLLLNILPHEIAEELKQNGFCIARKHENVSVLFADIKGFTNIAEILTAEQVVEELDTIFRAFDNIVEDFDLEKIKTIGDAYMCAGGLPVFDQDNPKKAIRAAIKMQNYMESFREGHLENKHPVFDMRIGIHTGPVVAGVVGNKKFSYDIWGDTVNTAARVEEASESGQINISEDTYLLVKEDIDCIYRGKKMAKNKGEINMYFVDRLQ